MSATYADGRGQDEERAFDAFGAFLRNSDWDWVELGEVRDFLDSSGFSNQKVWKAVNAYSSAGLVKSVERGGKTNLKLLREEWDTEDLLQRDSGGSTDEEWVDLYAVNDWARIGETRVPTLDTAVFDDFLERHNYDDVFRYSDEHVNLVAAYSMRNDEKIEHWRVLKNDGKREQDYLRLMVRFEDDAGFQPHNRTSYAEKVWTPFTVLQQRNAWVNEASRNAVGELDGAVDYWSKHHDNVTPSDAVELELKSLAGFDGEYDEILEAAARRYAEHDNSRLSRFLPHYSGQVESRFADGYSYVREGPLSIGTDHGRARTPVLVEVFYDRLHTEAEALSE